MYPIIDLNGCLLPYLAEQGGARPDATGEIGCALPRLRQGGVALQVLPVCVDEGPGGPDAARRQVERFLHLREEEPGVAGVVDPASIGRGDGLALALALENASGLCTEDEDLDAAFARWQRIAAEAGPLAYVTLTRRGENRFAGGCDSDAGLKDDGRHLLRFLDGRPVALDLAHAGSRLARDVLEFIEREGLRLPVIASHSNFRAVWPDPSNLADDVATEIIRRGGLIGINLIRAFVHPDDPDALARHVEHGLALGGASALCFGADFFCWRSHPDRSRVPFYFAGHEHAGRYPEILASLQPVIGGPACLALASGNAAAFLRRLWS